MLQLREKCYLCTLFLWILAGRTGDGGSWRVGFCPGRHVSGSDSLNIKKYKDMTKAEVVAEIANKTGIEKVTVLATVETMMEVIKENMVKGNNVYLRGFGSFIIKQRAQKTARNITQNKAMIVPAHNIPAFKPAKPFVEAVRKEVK